MFVCVTTSGQTNLRASWDVAIESTEHHLGSAFKAKKKKSLNLIKALTLTPRKRNYEG